MDSPPWVPWGPIWVWGTILGVQKCFRSIFGVGTRSGRVQMALQMAGFAHCLQYGLHVRRSKSHIFGSKMDLPPWVPGRPIWVWGTILGVQKCLRAFFEVRARSGRVQLGCQMARLVSLSLLYAAQPDGQKVDFLGQKWKNFPGSRKVIYGSAGSK